MLASKLGMKVSGDKSFWGRMLQGMKVPRKSVPGNKSSRVRKFQLPTDRPFYIASEVLVVICLIF